VTSGAMSVWCRLKAVRRVKYVNTIITVAGAVRPHCFVSVTEWEPEPKMGAPSFCVVDVQCPGHVRPSRDTNAPEVPGVLASDLAGGEQRKLSESATAGPSVEWWRAAFTRDLRERPSANSQPL